MLSILSFLLRTMFQIEAQQQQEDVFSFPLVFLYNSIHYIMTTTPMKNYIYYQSSGLERTGDLSWEYEVSKEGLQHTYPFAVAENYPQKCCYHLTKTVLISVCRFSLVKRKLHNRYH